jgi:hypothetical protein
VLLIHKNQTSRQIKARFLARVMQVGFGLPKLASFLGRTLNVNKAFLALREEEVFLLIDVRQIARG